MTHEKIVAGFIAHPEGQRILKRPHDERPAQYWVGVMTLRRYLTERVTLLHIHRFCPTDVQFTDALVSSAVVVFRKSHPPSGHRARFSLGGPIDEPQSEAFMPGDFLRHVRKWTQFPARTTVESTDEPTLGDLFSIKRGLATGSNSFLF
jgi:adenine-specific DNA-methyltransferase